MINIQRTGIIISYYTERYRKKNDLFRVTEQVLSKSIPEVFSREGMCKDGWP